MEAKERSRFVMATTAIGTLIGSGGRQIMSIALVYSCLFNLYTLCNYVDTIYLYLDIYIYICVCVCGGRERERERERETEKVRVSPTAARPMKLEHTQATVTQDNPQ